MKAIVTRFSPPSDADIRRLYVLTVIPEDPAGRRFRLFRRIQIFGIHCAFVGLCVMAGAAIGLIVDLFRGREHSIWTWFVFDLPLIVCGLVFIRMFRVERFYRRNGL